MDGERAYRALRHYSPEAVRNIRAALDVGSTLEELKRLCVEQVPAEFKDKVAAAIDYMADHPSAGAVSWDGLNYTWAGE